MTVEVIGLQNAFGGLNVTVFSDTLIGVDQPFYVGNSWLPVFAEYDIGTTAVSLQGGFNRTGAGLVILNPTGGGFLPVGLAIPYTYNLGAVRTRKQFVQFKVVTNPAGIARPIGICYANTNVGSWYEMVLNTDLSQLSVSRSDQGVQTTFIATGVGTAYVNNDIVRMECDPITNTSLTKLTLFKNGVQIATANDSTAGRLNNGVVGLGTRGANPGVATTISNYSGGAF